MTLKSLLSAFVVVVASTITSAALAQAPKDGSSNVRFARRPTPPEVTGDMPLTPELWLYSQQLQRYEDPKLAVRRKAEIRAQQRQQRIAARKAWGVSKHRPIVYNTPFHTYYSAAHHGFVATYPFYTFKTDSPEPSAE